MTERSAEAIRADPGMYGSDVNKATDLLYEVAAHLFDLVTGKVEVQDVGDALNRRLVPVADAALAEARRLAARAEYAEAQLNEIETLCDETRLDMGDRDVIACADVRDIIERGRRGATRD